MKETVKTLWIGYLLTHQMHIFLILRGLKSKIIFLRGF